MGSGARLGWRCQTAGIPERASQFWLFLGRSNQVWVHLGAPFVRLRLLVARRRRLRELSLKGSVLQAFGSPHHPVERPQIYSTDENLFISPATSRSSPHSTRTGSLSAAKRGGIPASLPGFYINGILEFCRFWLSPVSPIFPVPFCQDLSI